MTKNLKNYYCWILNIYFKNLGDEAMLLNMIQCLKNKVQKLKLPFCVDILAEKLKNYMV